MAVGSHIVIAPAGSPPVRRNVPPDSVVVTDPQDGLRVVSGTAGEGIVHDGTTWKAAGIVEDAEFTQQGGLIVGTATPGTPVELAPDATGADEGKVLVARAAETAGYGFEVPVLSAAFTSQGGILTGTAVPGVPVETAPTFPADEGRVLVARATETGGYGYEDALTDARMAAQSPGALPFCDPAGAGVLFAAPSFPASEGKTFIARGASPIAWDLETPLLASLLTGQGSLVSASAAGVPEVLTPDGAGADEGKVLVVRAAAASGYGFEAPVLDGDTAGGHLAGTYPAPTVVALDTPAVASLPVAGASGLHIALDGAGAGESLSLHDYIPAPGPGWSNVGSVRSGRAGVTFASDVARLGDSCCYTYSGAGGHTVTVERSPSTVASALARRQTLRNGGTGALTLVLVDGPTLKLYPGQVVDFLSADTFGELPHIFSVSEGLGLDVNDGTPLDGQRNLRISTAANAKTITLPEAVAGMVGWDFVRVKHITAGNDLVIAAFAGDTIDGAASVTSAVAGTYWHFHCSAVGEWDIR